MFQNHSQKKSLDAVAAMGMPVEFAIQTLLLARHFGVAIAIQEGARSHLYHYPAAPKPSNIKDVTGNWGLTKNVITEDPVLGCQLKNGVLVNANTEVPEDVIFTQHKVPLHEIFKGLQQQEWDMISPDPTQSATAYTQQTGKLFLKPNRATHPDAKKVIYQIDLTNITESDALPYLPLAQKQEKLPIPAFWQNAWGDFNQQLHQRYPVLYAYNARGEFKPINIYALKIDEKILPITGDLDILWITIPAATPKNTPYFHQDYNTSDPMDRLALTKQLDAFSQSQPEAKVTYTAVSLAKLGKVTAFEAYLILTINHYTGISIPHIKNLLQHGCANKSPYKPNSLNKRVLHFWQGELTLTLSERELVDYVLNTPSYLEKNFLTIHPQWNLALWGKVVAKQIELGQPISDALSRAYYEHTQATWRQSQNTSALFAPRHKESEANNTSLLKSISVK